MKMTSETRAIDKIYHRRDRYDIPDWQREKVWVRQKRQRLIDSILRGWRLPKFYFIAVSEEDYLVEDGQQRLEAIYDFFSNKLSLDEESAAEFGGAPYRDLPRKTADSFDDFEIQYDVIRDASDEELKDFFQRLQAGVSLNSSEKLNAVHSKLQKFCKSIAKHRFFTEAVSVLNTRYAHFDIMAKVATLEVESLDAGLRFEDVKQVFEAQANFSDKSAVAKRIVSALDFSHKALAGKAKLLRTRTLVQSAVTLACKLVGTGLTSGREPEFGAFLETFSEELAHQIELGQAATDTDYLTFQHSVNANVKGGAKTRHQILLRKLFRVSPGLADIFDPTIIKESGVAARINTVAASILELINQLNKKHAASKGDDLFKATNRTSQALVRLGKPIANIQDYGRLIDDLYFLFWESTGSRLDSNRPTSFSDVNALRTDLRHDLDHGDKGKTRSKRKRAGSTFASYSGSPSPDTLATTKFALVQANILGAIEGDLRVLLLQTT
jgi:hypothetical protein